MFLLILQLVLLNLCSQRSFKEHFSTLRQVGDRCYLDLSKSKEFVNLVSADQLGYAQSIPDFRIHGHIIQGVPFGALHVGSADNPQRLVFLIDTGSNHFVAKGKFALQPLTEIEVEKYFENNPNKFFLQQTCPSGFEAFVCTEADYLSASFLTALGKTNIFSRQGWSFLTVLEYILGKTDHSPEFFKKSKIVSLLGVGYQNGDFMTNDFLVSARTALIERGSEEVPKTFTLSFLKDKLEAEVGERTVNKEFVWFPLRSGSLNTTTINELCLDSQYKSIKLLERTNVLFDTGSNVVSLPFRQFAPFKKGLAQMLAKIPDCFMEDDEHLNNAFYLCVPDGFEMETRISFETGAVMVLNFADFLPFEVEGNKCSLFIGDEQNDLLIIGLSAWKGFDLVLDGDRNRIGFKPNENCCKFCSISESIKLI